MAGPLALEGKAAVVTGGGGIIGSATVRLLTEFGVGVLAVDIDEHKAAAAAASAPGAVPWTADVTDPGAVETMVARAVKEWGRIDIGINIVGGGGASGRPILDTSDDEWQDGVEHNLLTAVRCCRAYARTMIDSRTSGSIVNIASPAGLRAAPGMVTYGAAKAALINFTWTLAVELAPHGIRANVVVPAFVPNPEVAWGGSPAEQDELARRMVPMGRVTRAEDVAGAIVAFASGLTSYSTGQMIVCDGGRLLTNPINTGFI